MTRRLLTAVATALILYGVVGARLGQAQPQTGTTPAAPSQEPPVLPDDPDEGGLPPGDPPPPLDLGGGLPLPSADEPPGLPQSEGPPESQPEEPPRPAGQPEPSPPPLESEPAPPSGTAKAGETPGSRDPFGPETVPVEAGPKADEVIQAQAPTGDGNPLPPAKEAEGAAPAASGAVPPPGDPRILPADRLPMTPSTAALTVEVQAPATANLNRPVTFKIFIKNSGTSPAMGVLVHDLLPDGLEFVKSEPAVSDRIGPILQWQLDSLAAGAEKVITLTATPRKTGDFDHAPTVSLRTGSKSRTMVKHPKLKVELTREESGPILKGRPVRFAVRVTNNGTGPAGGVILHANLTGGLKHEAGSSLEVIFKEYLKRDALNPGESEVIDLEVDAVAGGEQVCKVSADSPDVEDTEEAHAEAKVTVVEPKLTLEITGSPERPTDSVASYTMTVTNPGTATARNVVAAAFLPDLGGRLESEPPGTTYTSSDRRIYWKVGDLEPNTPKTMTFNVRLGGVGIFKVEAKAKADGCPIENDTTSTDVIGVPNIKCVVLAQTSVMGVGEENLYEIQLKNAGTKEASDLLVNAVLSPNLTVEDAGGTDQKAMSSTPERHDAKFPVIKLPPEGALTLTLRVKATAAGPAKCTITATHGVFVTETSLTTKVNEPR